MLASHMHSPNRVEKMDSFLLVVAAELPLNRDSGRVGDWGRLGGLTTGPASTEVGDDIIGILILFSAALGYFLLVADWISGWFILLRGLEHK